MREAGEGNGEAKQEKEAAESGEAETEAAQGAADELAAKVQKLEEELKEARQRVVYTLAEMENVRAIARRDAETARKFAVQGFAKGLLDVADNLSRAIEAVPKEGEKDPALTVLLEGVEMTEAQLHKAFAAQNLERYGAPGDAFDPNLHDALYEYEDPSLSPGSVGQVMKPGYKLHGRVIRAAQVGCVKKQ